MHQNLSGRLAPIIILNIDDEAYRAWGESSITPRDKLAGLMLFSLKAGAAVIVLDIDLSRPGGSKEHDAMLANLVTGELSNAASQSRASKIILARRVVQDSESNQWIRKLYFESSMPDQGRSLQAGTTTFLVDDDQVVRRWQLAKTTCDRGVSNAGHALQLLVAATLFDAQAKLDDARQVLAVSGCSTAGQNPKLSASTSLELSEGFQVPLDDRSLISRMRFRFDWSHNRYGDFSSSIVGGRTERTLVVIPAMLALQYPLEKAENTLRGAIVLIGNTHYDSTDMHITPLGEMPGVLLVANAIYSLLNNGVMKQPHMAVVMVIEIVLILLLAALFTWVSTRYTLWVGLPLGLLLLFLVAVGLFYFGVWFDYVTPLFGPITHQLIVGMHMKNGVPHGG